MGHWGKILGTGVGLALGGPIGAVVGGVFGGMYDVAKKYEGDYISDPNIYKVYCPHCNTKVVVPHTGVWKCPSCQNAFEFNGINADDSNHQFTDNQYVKSNYRSRINKSKKDIQAAYVISLLAMLVYVSKADGNITREEVREIKHFFKHKLFWDKEDMDHLRRLLNEMVDKNIDLLDVCLQFRKVAPYELRILAIDAVYRIALADRHFHQNERKSIETIANTLGVSETDHKSVKSLHIKIDEQSYAILGVTISSSNKDIKEAYKKLVQEYHPDKLSGKGLPDDFLKFANQKMAAINEAYNKIKTERGL